MKLSRRSIWVYIGFLVLLTVYSLLVLWDIIHGSIAVPILFGVLFAAYLLFEKKDELKPKFFCFAVFLPYLLTAIVATLKQ